MNTFTAVEAGKRFEAIGRELESRGNQELGTNKFTVVLGENEKDFIVYPELRKL